jgi:hypothetical protein
VPDTIRRPHRGDTAPYCLEAPPDIQRAAPLTAAAVVTSGCGWCSRDDNGEIYYFNFKTGDSEWDHPCDAIFHDKCVRPHVRIAPSS